jgi:hypothetical protein
MVLWQVGIHMASGDLNKDGYEDLIISSPHDDYAAYGRFYVIWVEIRWILNRIGYTKSRMSSLITGISLCGDCWMQMDMAASRGSPI